MKSLLFVLAATVGLASAGTLATDILPFGKSKEIKIEVIPPTESPLRAEYSTYKVPTSKLVLNKRNTVVFRGVVTETKVAQVQLELMEMSRKLTPDEVIYLALDTPGGDIDAGLALVDTLNAIPQKVKTVTIFAASMGFQFVQQMEERLIVPSGKLMSHRARFNGYSGQVPGEFNARFNFMYRQVVKMDAHAAKRMNMSLADYQNLVHDEYWVAGADAVVQRAADRLVLATCDRSFEGTTDEFLGEIFGIQVFGVFHTCPLITGLLGFKLKGGNNLTSDAERARQYFSNYENREEFIEKAMAMTRNQ